MLRTFLFLCMCIYTLGKLVAQPGLQLERTVINGDSMPYHTEGNERYFLVTVRFTNIGKSPLIFRTLEMNYADVKWNPIYCSYKPKKPLAPKAVDSIVFRVNDYSSHYDVSQNHYRITSNAGNKDTFNVIWNQAAPLEWRCVSCYGNAMTESRPYRLEVIAFKTKEAVIFIDSFNYRLTTHNRQNRRRDSLLRRATITPVMAGDTIKFFDNIPTTGLSGEVEMYMHLFYHYPNNKHLAYSSQVTLPVVLNLSIDKPHQDFGKVKQGDMIRQAFTIRNEGTITAEMNGRCLDVDKTKIKPGESALAYVKHDTRFDTGHITLEEYIITKPYSRSLNMRMTMEGHVIAVKDSIISEFIRFTDTVHDLGIINRNSLYNNKDFPDRDKTEPIEYVLVDSFEFRNVSGYTIYDIDNDTGVSSYVTIRDHHDIVPGGSRKIYISHDVTGLSELDIQIPIFYVVKMPCASERRVKLTLHIRGKIQ